MKMILEFNLPDEQQEANETLNVGKLTMAIGEYAEKLRQKAKYSNDPQEREKAAWARHLLFKELEEVMRTFDI